MKILVISDAFYPIESPRSYRTQELVLELLSREVEVTLATTKIQNRELQGYSRLKLVEWNSYQKFWDVTLRSRLIRGLLKYTLDLPDSIKSIYIYLLLKHKRLGKFDTVISIAYPHSMHWGIYFLSLIDQLKYNSWLADSGDPYAGCETDRLKKPFFLRLLEKKAFERATHLSIPFEGAKNAYAKQFLPKIQIIPQAFNFTKLTQTILQNGNSNIIIDQSKVNFAYAGGFVFGKREPYHLIDALYKLENRNFCFHIFTKEIIDTARNSVKSLLASNNVRIYSALPRIELLSELQKMDFLINLSNQNLTQLPSKIIDYIYLEKPFFTYGYDDFSIERLIEFLSLDFNSSEQNLYSLDDYDIHNVVNKIVGLTSKNA